MTADTAVQTEQLLRRPLRAYRVLELPGALTLPYGKTFADLGADVIKVEPPDGDPARALPPLIDGRTDPDASLYWAAYSAGKRSVTANLESDEGRSLIRRLAAKADVLVESFPPGTLDALGLGYAALREENPRLVYVSITPFGQTGPYADRKGSDLVQMAMSGYLNMTGPADDTPIKPSAPYQSWLHGSMQAAAATMIALRQRRRTGVGTHIDQAMRDTGMWMLTHTYQFWDLLGVNLKRQGAERLTPTTSGRSIYPCADGYVVWVNQFGRKGTGNRIAIQELIRRMADAGMADEWLLDLDIAQVQEQETDPEQHRRFADAVGRFLVTVKRNDVIEWAITRGVMIAPVQTLRELLTDPQMVARNSLFSLPFPTGAGAVQMPGPPVRLGPAEWAPAAPAPTLGAHNAAVYGEDLGLTAEQIAALTVARAI